MAADADAYRTLGLAPGAPLAEVKRAYRRLAKANHPDAAGEAALPRFLAIQSAYDRIVDPDGTTAAGPGRASPAGAPGRPWEADADRARATHRAYGGRARRTRSTRSGAASGPPGATGAAPGDATNGNGTGPAGEGSPRERPPRPPKKATLGSTSYDGADAEPFEPDWGGASWYGTTSGTYWTLNPKEYADPRKHGPEYQARARRAAEAAAARARAAGAGPADATGTSDPIAPDAEPTPSHTTASWWAATDAGAATDARAAAATQTTDETTTAPGGEDAGGAAPSADPLVAATWLDAGSGTAAGRVGRAVIGWAPIALGLGWLVGEATGCGRFSASCDPASTPLMLLLQVLLLGVLLLVPRLAGVAVVGAVGTLAAAVPGALVLASMGGASDTPSSRAALAVVLIGGWVAGIAVGVARDIRRARPLDRPVS